MKTSMCMCALILASGLAVADARAQELPTPAAKMWMEAVAVNDRPLPAPRTKLQVAPGDTISIRMMVKDFSPNDNRLRAYQASLDYAAYESGTSGQIRPRDYDETTAKQVENKQYATIDTNVEDYVFENLPSFGAVDSISPGYRYLGALVDVDDSPVAEAGRHYVIGHLGLEVTDDAAGMFTIKFNDDPKFTVLRDNNRAQILPMDLGHVEIEVLPAGRLFRITNSVPAGDQVVAVARVTDVRRRVELELAAAVDNLAPGDFELADGTSNPPAVEGIETDGSRLVLRLDRPLRDGCWTTIEHAPSGAALRIGVNAGDVSGDGLAGASDVLFLLEQLRKGESLPAYRGDVNADGRIDHLDAIEIIEVINARSGRRSVLP